jgi:hypothetical protein
MKVFPIHVPRHPYRGSNPSKRQKMMDYNRDADRLEKYLNDRIQADPSPIQQYIYGFIAPDVGLSVERVREILFGVDSGHNGLTVAKTGEALRREFDGTT